MKTTDPLTGKSTHWTSAPSSPLYTIPAAAATNDRAFARWGWPWELPNVTATLGGKYFCGHKSWQGYNPVVGRWSADFALEDTFKYDQGNKTYVDGLLAQMHTSTALHANPSAATIEWFLNDYAQGPGNIRAYTLTAAQAPGTTPTSIGQLTVPALFGQAAGSLAYMLKTAFTASAKRIIAAAFKLPSTSSAAAALIQTGNLATTGWAALSLVTPGSAHQIATIGATTLITFGGLYGNGTIGAACTLDDGTTWNYLTPTGPIPVPANGMTAAAYTAADYWLVNNDAGVPLLADSRLLLAADGLSAWIIAHTMNPVDADPYQRLSGTAAHYIYQLNLQTGACTPHGPFLSGQYGWFAGADAEWDTNGNIRLIRAIPQTATNPNPTYNDYPAGGPTLQTYRYTPATPDTAPAATGSPITLANLPQAGSIYDYTDKAPTTYPWHKNGYGDHQVILACRTIPGAPGILAINASHQRPQDVDQFFHQTYITFLNISARL